jgi:hypothetical protein
VGKQDCEAKVRASTRRTDRRTTVHPAGQTYRVRAFDATIGLERTTRN